LPLFSFAIIAIRLRRFAFSLRCLIRCRRFTPFSFFAIAAPFSPFHYFHIPQPFSRYFAFHAIAFDAFIFIIFAIFIYLPPLRLLSFR